MTAVFAGQGAVTGVESLPFANPVAAVDFVAAHAPQVPFWPQLPAHHPQDGMLRQGLGGQQGLVLDRTAIDGTVGLVVKPGRRQQLMTQLHTEPAGDPGIGFGPFLTALERRQFPQARAIKGQLTGPVTLGRYLHPYLHPGAGPAGRDTELLEAVDARIRKSARRQTATLLSYGLPVVVVVDEPVIGTSPIQPSELGRLTAVLDVISHTGGLAGLHTCGTEPSSALAALPFDLLSVDFTGQSVVSRPWHGPWSWVGAGLITTPPGRVETAMANWQRHLPPSLRQATAVQRSLITATCGLGGTTSQVAQRSFVAAAAVSRQLTRLCDP